MFRFRAGFLVNFEPVAGARPRNEVRMRADSYPYEVVRIRCHGCDLTLDLDRDEFVRRVGADTPLSSARTRLDTGCGKEKPTTTSMHAPCRPYYADDWWPKSD